MIQYAEDLMVYQSQQGYKVSYFFSGRKFPYGRVTRLKRFLRGRVSCYEVINSVIIHGGDQGSLRPDLNLSEPVTEEIFRKVLVDVKPDLIHVHELAGLPSSLIDIAKQEFALPVIMTLADYFLLCPTLKLFTYENEVCTANEVGKTCRQCCRCAPKDNRFDVKSTLNYRFVNTWLYKHLPMRSIMHILETGRMLSGGVIDIPGEDHSKLYQKRRIQGITRLRSVDLLIARAGKVAEIYRNYLGEDAEIEVINPTLMHIDNIVFSRINPSGRIKFVTLNGMLSIAKGGQLILDAVKHLNEKGLVNRFEVHVYGHIDPLLNEQARLYENIYYKGTYHKNHIDKVLDGMHVGILPSIWEEVYGYVGVEILAKGLPLIANNVGGISEYAKNDFNCIMNTSKTAEELADHMDEFIKCPDLIKQYNENIARQKRYSFADHFEKIQKAYLSVVSAGG